MDILFLLKLLILPFAVISPGLFAGAETALTSLSSIQIARIKERFPSVSPYVLFWETSSDKVLTIIILGNTFATVFCGVLSASIGKEMVDHIFPALQEGVILASSFLIGLAVLIFGEILPKILGRLYPETIAPRVIAPLVYLTRTLHPLVRILARLAGFFIKIFGKEVQKELPVFTSSELQGMLDSEMIPEGQNPPKRILKNLLEFGCLEAQAVQKPIEKVFMIDLNLKPKEALEKITQSLYSRIPVYKGSLDNIVGIIYAKDLLNAWRTEGLILIPDILRPIYFISEKTSVNDLLREFKQGHHHFAMVKNSAGKVTGIVTIEDLLEEIVGELYDETKVF